MERISRQEFLTSCWNATPVGDIGVFLRLYKSEKVMFTTSEEITNIEGERIEYRLQPAGLGAPVMPAEAGTLYALSQRL